VKIVEKINGSVTSTKPFVWCGKQLCERRDSSGANVVSRFFADGETEGVDKVYDARDHMGSVRDVCSTSSALLMQYEYDPYGRRTKVSGSAEGSFGYTGHYYHMPSGLHLALCRAYDADIGRWLNRDPIGEYGGLNLYGYVYNNPINLIDPFGLAEGDFKSTAINNALKSIGSTSTYGDLQPVKGTPYKFDPNSQKYLRFDLDASHKDPNIHFSIR
jgi:RHS repeat-associated protein